MLLRIKVKSIFILIGITFLSLFHFSCQKSSGSHTKRGMNSISDHQKDPNTYSELLHSDSLVPLEDFFSKDTQAFAFVLPSLKPLGGVGGVEAKNCKMCHTQYYEEWSQTTHAHALKDLQFQAELAKPGTPKWLCLNCHIPNEDQREYKVIGLDSGHVLKPVMEKNPNYKKSFRDEAISCATCHLKQDESGHTVVVGAIGSNLAPHPIRKDPKALRNTCLRCHDPKGEAITPNLLCWFQTKAELDANPKVQDRDCVSCHMPTEMGSLVPGLPKRMRHQHHWVGGGIPKTMDGFDSILKRGYHSGLEVESKIQESKVQLTLINKSGHALPSADPERYYRVHLIQKLSDQIIQDSIYRIGQVWEWSPAKKISDSRLMGGEVRTLIFDLDERILKSLSSHSEIEILISHHRLSIENLNHMKNADVDDRLVSGIRSQMKQMEKLYPRFRFTHKLIYNRASNESEWILEKWTEEQLNEFSKEQHF